MCTYHIGVVKLLKPEPEPTLNNPYNAPSADLSNSHDAGATYLPKMLELRGRIGRVRYLAYTFGLSLLLGLAMIALMGVLAMISVELMMLGFVMYIPLLGATLVVAARRLNDLGHSGWLSLLTLVPVLNFFFGLWLIFGAGNAGPNQYGLPPSKNTNAIVWLACILPIVFIVGISAAVAIPAYQDYVNRAKAAQALSVPGQ